MIPNSNRYKVNSSIRKHKCKTCTKSFKTSAELNIHTRIHLKQQKRFACDQCQMKFSTKGNLSLHKLIHTGERPFNGDLCPKKFAHSHHLKRHKRIHTGEKPYQCDICQMKFSQSSNFMRHKIMSLGNFLAILYFRVIILQNISICLQWCEIIMNVNTHVLIERS